LTTFDTTEFLNNSKVRSKTRNRTARD